MSDIRNEPTGQTTGQTTGQPTGQGTASTGARVPRQRTYEAPPEPTAWTGWVVFGAMMMILLGSFSVIEGLVALFNSRYYLVPSSDLLVNVNFTAYGWVHVIVGLAALAAGFGLIRGAMWARVLGVVVAGVSALVNLAFLPAFPIWALMMITLDVLVVYAIIVHGAELKD